MSETWNKPPWFTSYEEHNFGELFYSLMRIYQPKKIVELGTKAGFSAYHMARALRQNGNGQLYCYDLWENYQFNSVPKSVAEKNLEPFGGIVSLEARDVVDVHNDHESTDILHVDLGNEGGILEKVIPNWIDKTTQLIIIEGGSTERDKVEWMAKFNKMPIRDWLADFRRRRGDVEYLTIEPFPSLTLIRRTR